MSGLTLFVGAFGLALFAILTVTTVRSLNRISRIDPRELGRGVSVGGVERPVETGSVHD